MFGRALSQKCSLMHVRFSLLYVHCCHTHVCTRVLARSLAHSLSRARARGVSFAVSRLVTHTHTHCYARTHTHTHTHTGSEETRLRKDADVLNTSRFPPQSLPLSLSVLTLILPLFGFFLKTKSPHLHDAKFFSTHFI